MSLGFLVDQIYLVSSGNYDPHAKDLRFLGFFYLPSSIGCTSEPRVLYSPSPGISFHLFIPEASRREKQRINQENNSCFFLGES